MTASLETLGLRWFGVPIHSIQRAAGILGTSQHRIESLLEDGTLKAVVFTGEKEKRLVTTESLVAYLATAQEWTPPLLRSPPKRKTYDNSPGEPYEEAGHE